MEKVIKKMAKQVYIILWIMFAINIIAVVGTMYLQISYLDPYFIDSIMACVPAIVTAVVVTLAACGMVRVLFNIHIERIVMSSKARAEQRKRKMQEAKEQHEDTEQDYHDELNKLLAKAHGEKKQANGEGNGEEGSSDEEETQEQEDESAVQEEAEESVLDPKRKDEQPADDEDQQVDYNYPEDYQGESEGQEPVAQEESRKTVAPTGRKKYNNVLDVFADEYDDDLEKENNTETAEDYPQDEGDTAEDEKMDVDDSDMDDVDVEEPKEEIIDAAESNKEDDYGYRDESDDVSKEVAYPETTYEEDAKEEPAHENKVYKPVRNEYQPKGNVLLDISTAADYSSIENRYLKALGGALANANVDKSKYSIGFFIPGRVSIFRTTDEVWHVSDETMNHASECMNYPSIAKAGAAFTKALS